jgi:hypothetical protein
MPPTPKRRFLHAVSLIVPMDSPHQSFNGPQIDKTLHGHRTLIEHPL